MKSIIEKTIAALMIAFVASGALAEETTTPITAPAAWGGTKPVAVWEGDFSVLSHGDGTTTYTIAVDDDNGAGNTDPNAVSQDASYIAIGSTSSKGIYISATGGSNQFGTGGNANTAGTGYTTLVKYSNYVNNSDTAIGELLTYCINVNGTGDKERIGVANSNGWVHAVYKGAPWNDNNNSGRSASKKFTDSLTKKSVAALRYKYGSEDGLGSQFFLDGVNAYNGLSLREGGVNPYGIVIGGKYYTTNPQLVNSSGMKVHGIMFFKSAIADADIKTWSDWMGDITESQHLTASGGSFVGGDGCGVTLNGGTVAVSELKTAEALFVQSDTTLDFSGDSSSRLDISGPLYVADGKTLTIKLGTLSNGYRMPITMGSCFASNNQVVLKYETPAGSTSTPVVSGTSIKVFTEAEDAEAITISDYTPWSYAIDVFTWISPYTATGKDVALWKYILFDVETGATATGATAIEGGTSTAYDTAATPSNRFWWYWCYTGSSSYPGYSAPGLVARFLPDDNENTYLKEIPAGFGPLTIGGLIVEAGARGYSFENPADTRWTTLGDPTGQAEARFTILEDFAINRNGGLNLVGTSYFDIAAGKVFSLNAGRADNQQPVMRATVGAAADNGTITSGIVDGGCLMMHGEGQIAATKLTASSACLDYSDLSASRGVPYIDAQLVVDSNTSYKFPALSGATTYQLARRLVDTSGVTGDQIFSIDGHEYQAPLSFNDISGTVVFPAVATVNGSGSEVDWSAISWDATPATIGNSDVVTLNITGNTTLDFDTTISIGKLVLNISDGAELSLSNLANLTTANGIVLRGAGTLKIDAATTISRPITVDGNVSILFEGNAAALTVSGTLTINAGKTLYIAAANWTTPALAGTRDVLTATTLTNNGTITMGAITGDTGRDYTASVADNKVSVMRMTAETFAYDTYPDGGSATGWATSWGGNFDTNQLRVGPSSDYPYAYYTTSSAHPYQDTLSNRGDSISFSIYADLSQTPSAGKAVIVGFGGSATADNKLLLFYREESAVKWAVIDRGPDDGTTAVLGNAASVTLPAGGYHLYTGTFDKSTGNLQLFLDNESAVSGTSAADTTIAGGMQIGNAFQGVAQFKGTHGFVMGTNAAIVAMRGYNAILDAEEVGILAGRYPATTGAIDRAIQPKITGKTLTVYSSSEGATGYTFGPDAGNVVIAAGNTVNVTTFHTYPSGSTDGSDNAVTINGTLNVSQSDSTIGDGANKGVVIGYWLQATSGTRKTSVTVSSGGTLDASNAYILIPYNGNVQEATLNITGGTVKTKGLYGNDTAGVVTGKVVLRDNGVLEVTTIPSDGKAITKEFKHGTFRVKADAEETRAIDFSAAGGYATTLDPDGHTLTMSSAAMRGAGAVTVGGSNGGTVVFSGFTSAYTGALTINDANKDMVSVTSWDNFKGTLNYAVTDGTLDLTSYSIDSAAIINVTGSGATVKLKTGPTVNVSSGATAQLYVSESVYKYDGFIYKGASSGTVEYYQGETPTKVTSEYMNGANLLPYYSIFQGHADGDNYVGNLATPSDWKNGTDDGFVVPTTRNAAIYVPDGKTLTVTIDNTSTFGEVQLYTDPGATYGGTVVFKKGESGSMTVSSVMCVTAMTGLKIDEEDPGVVFGSGAEINLASGTMVTFNATSYSAPKITGSGIMVVSANKAVTFTGNVNVATGIVNGSATVSSGTLTATSLTVDGTLNIGGNTLAATTVVGTGRVEYTDKVPDSSSWATGTATTGWRGTVAFSKEIRGPNLNDFGNAYSTVALTGVSGTNTYLPDTDITTNVRIEGEVTINNGNPLAPNKIENWTAQRVVAMRSLDVNGTLTLRKAGNTSWDNLWCYYYTSVLKCGDSGSIDIGNQFALRVDAVDFTEAPSGDGCIVPISLTRGGADKADGILYGPNGVAGEDIPVTVNGVANGQMLIYGTIDDVSGLYLAVAKVGNNYYLDLEEAEAAMSAANPCLVVFNEAEPAGTYHNLGTVGGFTTYRLKNQNVYYQTGKDWSPNTDGLFKLGDGTVTAAYAGDTIVIDNSSTGDLWASPADAVAATDISVQRSVTIKQGEGSGNLFDGKTFTIADGATLTISGASRAVTLGTVTFDKAEATGAVTLDGSANAITLGGNLAGTAPATITGTVIATGKTIANTLKNTTGGTIVYDGTLPGTVPTFDSSWTGTVGLKNYTSLTGSVKQGDTVIGTTSFDPNSYGNENSTVKFTGVKGYLTATSDGSYTIQPALELEDNGDTPGLLLYNGWGYNKEANSACYTIIRELKGSGTLKADPTADGAGGTIKGFNVLLQVLNWGNFTGTLNMPNKNVVFGSTLPAQLDVEGGGKIFVRSGATVTIPSSKTWTCGTFYVDGTLSAVNKSAWSGAMQVGDSGVLEITRSDDASSNDGDTNYAADVSGSGTLKYSGTGFTVISTKIPASLTVEANKDSGIIVPAAGVTIGSLAGSKNIRSDWNTSAAGGRHLTIKQSRDTTWSGVFFNAEDRLSSVIVDPGASATGTLTLAGDQVTANSGYANNKQQNNDLVVNGAVKLTGKWVGPITVSGTFGGNGTASSAVTFNAGSTYRYDTGYLNASGGVVVNAGDVVWVETEQEPTAGMVLMDWTATSGSNAAPAGIFRFKNTDYRGEWTPTIVGNQLVVNARTSTIIDVAAEVTSERSDNFADCTINKTGDGKAILTGSIQGASLDIDGGTVELKSAATIEDLTGDVGTKLIISANLDMRDVATLDDFAGTIEIAKGVKVIVSAAVKDALVALQSEGYYNVIANKDGSYTISVAPSGTVIQFVTNDLGANINVPEDDEGVEYIPDNGNVAVKIGSAPIKLDNFTGMNRVTPFTLSLDVTIPEEIDYTGYGEEFGPVLFSFNAGPNEIFIMRKSNGVMAARFYPYNSGDSTTDYAAVSGQKVAAKILELGKTYHIDLRYWGALASKDGDTYKVNRGFGSAKTGTTVFVDGVEDWHHNGLRWGSMTLHKTGNTANGYSVNGKDFIGDAATQEPLADEEFHKSYIFPTNIVIGAATKATGTGERVFKDLVVRGVGFMNLAGFYEKAGVDTVNAALPSMISSDSLATYWYDYGVTASSVSGGYALGEQTTYGVNGGEVSSTYSRGVIMNHMQLGEGKFTITMGVSIPAGTTGGTICEIPMNSDSITVTYDGSTDKFALNGTAQDEAAGDGAHVLVLTYDTAYGAYLWVDSYDEDGEKTNATISDAVCRGKTLSNAIYFGSGAAATSSNGFFAGLGVAHQNVQFGYAVCDEADVETALKSFDFGPELASMPLSMRLKCLANISPDGATIPVPTITIGSKVLTGYEALSAAMAMGIYTNYVTSLSMSSYDSSTGNMACEVDPNFAGKMSVSLVGSTNNLVWTRLAVSTIAENATSVSLPLGSHAFGNGGDYRWFKILEEPYTNNAPVEVGRIHEKLADRPTTDFIFKKGETGWNQDVYRIPAMAATPDGQTVMGIFDARYCYQDLGVPLDANGNGAGPYDSPNHYTGIDIGGVFSLDAGENWSYPQVMIDVPNASNPQTGAKTTTLTKDMELGDPSIVYDSTNSKFIMMGITGGGLTTVHNGAEAVDVVTYECTLESVKNGAPKWTNRTSVKQLIEAQLNSEYSIQTNDYKTGWYGNGYMGILQGPGHAFVTRAACGSIPAGTVVWPMQYVIRNSGIKGGNFAAWKDSSGNWHATKLVPSSGGTNNYVTQEGCITQLDNGYLLYMCKNVTDGTKRPFYVSSDGVNWTYHTEITGLASGSMCQGSMLRLGYGSDGNSRYAAVFATGALRSDIKVYIGTDTGSGGITWDAEPYETVWAGATGTADDDGDANAGGGPHGNLVYGYNSLVMLNPTTLGVLFEAHGHIYFTKVDVSSVLQ